MLDNRECIVRTADELDAQIRDILAIELIYPDKADEISGTLHVQCTDDSVKQARLIPELEARGVLIDWIKIQP